MFKLMGLLRRLDGITHEEFVAYWKDHHSQLAKQAPGLRAYKLSILSAKFEGGGPAYDGYGELWFDSKEAFERATQTEIWRTIRADIVNFKSEGPLFLCEEEVDVLPRG
jgi:uncharacterized protein (TIGR02118 family)